MMDIHAPDKQAIERDCEGFEVVRIAPLPVLRATAVELTHPRSGARILHVYAPADNENCFAVTFPTPPPDDTGLPHILEHAVLGGSRRFPVREPFFEMVKMSMATFINAMTATVYTLYPVASNVRKDFFNLVEVYLDAVFQPLLTESIFRSEGHHLALAQPDDPASPLTVSGIVFNEMKGAYSAPEQLMGKLVESGLNPDTPAGRDSGGDPARIPELTFEAFKAFHRDHYHPGNGLFFLYGDIPTVDHLRFLAPVLEPFDRRPPAPKLGLQPRWRAPCRLAGVYPAAANEPLAARTFLTLNWLVGDALDPVQAVDWTVLATLLFGNEAAPLKRALIDSKLGTDVFYCGAGARARDLAFHAGLRGAEPDRAEAFERLVIETLERLAATPFAPAAVEAAFQQVAYQTLEVQTGFPIHVLFTVMGAWAVGGDPLPFLNGRDRLAACRARYAADPMRFNRMIRDALVANPHRLRVALRPDVEAQARDDAAFAARMAALRDGMTADELAAVAASAASLAAEQGTPNAPDALACLPQLRIGDLPARPRRLPTTVDDVAGITVLRNDVFANGVNYLHIEMDLAGLPAALYRWLPRYSDMIAKLGAAGQDYARIAARRAACTGGLSAHAGASLHAVDPARTVRGLRFCLRTLDEQIGNALGLLGDLIFAPEPNDCDRLRDVLAQARDGCRAGLINGGPDTIRRQATRGFNAAAALDYLWGGVDALPVLDTLTDAFDAHADALVANLERIRDFLVQHARWTVSFTGSDAGFRAVTRALEDWTARRAPSACPDEPPPFTPFEAPPREGLAGQMQVAHCLLAMPAPPLGHPDTPLLRIGAYLATFDYLLPEIRLKGNAYGAGIRHDDAQGTLVMSSFRDPGMAHTVAVFEALRGYLAAQRWTQADIERAVIGSVKDMERPVRPAEATAAALNRYRRGDDDGLREARYAAALRATPEAVRETVLRVLDAERPHATVCIMGSRDRLEAANRELGADAALAIRDILRVGEGALEG